MDRTKDRAIKQHFLAEPCNSQIGCLSVRLSCICPLKVDEFDKICCCVEHLNCSRFNFQRQDDSDNMMRMVEEEEEKDNAFRTSCKECQPSFLG